MKLSIAHIPFRIRIALLVAGAALFVRLHLPGPPAPTLRGVGEMLGKSVDGEVLPGDFLWEPSRGVLGDALLGRRVIFLARSGPDHRRDLYRAAVRVSLEGKPIAVRHVVNLTDSPFGDEQGLVGSHRHVAYATVAFGSIQQVTLLDLEGQVVETPSLFNRVMSHLTNFQTTGSFVGLGRTEVSANLEGSTVGVSLRNGILGVTTESLGQAFEVSVETGEVVSRANDGIAVSSMRVPQLPKPSILWAVDTVRAVTGPEFIAWLEENVFDARDMVKRAGHHAFGTTEEMVVVDGPPGPPAPHEVKAVGAETKGKDTAWPPQDLRTIWKNPEEGEGVWRRPRHRFLQSNQVDGAEEAPAYFYQTHVRPDPKRPWSKVWMVAMDARQIELGMQGGIEDPKPLTGARGEGRIPRDPEILHRAVGAFNGGFKTTHGEYGMMVERRVLLPPKAGAATIVVTDDGRTGFGTWPSSTTIPRNLLSFRQNLDPLVEGGQANPSNRKQWGWHTHTTGMLTHRSGFCLTSAGHMVYAWGPELTGETLGNAMVQAGCTYAVHLDMNPRHTAFAYIDTRKRHEAALLHPGMEVLPERFIVWSPKDFFYLTLRNFSPPTVEGVAMKVDKGVHPAPEWAPTVFEGSFRSKSGKRATLRAFRLDRTQYRIFSGGRERMAPETSGRVLAALVTGTGVSGLSDLESAILQVSPSGEVEVLNSTKPKAAGGQHIHLPLLTHGSKGKGRSAIGTSRGYLWLAEAEVGSDEVLVEALEKVGCEAMASLDGNGQDGKFHRTGTSAPPMDWYETPALYVLGSGLGQRAFRWEGSDVP